MGAALAPENTQKQNNTEQFGSIYVFIIKRDLWYVVEKIMLRGVLNMRKISVGILCLIILMVSVCGAFAEYNDSDFSWLDELTINQLRTLYSEIQKRLPSEESDTSLLTIVMEGSSMNDTIAASDVLTIKKCGLDDVKLFDIVAVNYMGRGDTVFIKRIAGLPGDTIELYDGYLYVNNIQYDEPYINDEYRSGPLNNLRPYTLPEGKFFVLGDYRNNSNDSRSIGPLDDNMLIGVVVAINGQPYSVN